ncbi:MAG TPA: hypothetical protein VK932_09870 [Kofleriaceae bacterium]|nr:hypothetical protein [Kofleriaceae bacterium]
MHVKLSLIATSCLIVRAAAAQPPPPDEPSQSVLPGVLSTAVGGTFDGRIDFSDFGDNILREITLLALNLHGQYISPSGLGGYLALPLAYVSGGDDSEAYLGNLELGGLYVFRGAGFDAYLRGGLAPNTGTDEGIPVPIANVIPRPADAYSTGLNTTWLRGGGGARLTSGSLVVAGSGGIDIPLERDDSVTLLHLTGSIGIAQPVFGLAAGVTLIQVFERDGADSDDSYFGFQLVGDAAIGGRSRLYGALGLNFEDDAAFSIGAGVRAGF